MRFSTEVFVFVNEFIISIIFSVLVILINSLYRILFSYLGLTLFHLTFYFCSFNVYTYLFGLFEYSYNYSLNEFSGVSFKSFLLEVTTLGLVMRA